MKKLEVFEEDEIQHWERYTRLLHENRVKINEIIDDIEEYKKQRAKKAKHLAKLIKQAQDIKHEQE